MRCRNIPQPFLRSNALSETSFLNPWWEPRMPGSISRKKHSLISLRVCVCVVLWVLFVPCSVFVPLNPRQMPGQSPHRPKSRRPILNRRRAHLIVHQYINDSKTSFDDNHHTKSKVASVLRQGPAAKLLIRRLRRPSCLALHVTYARTALVPGAHQPKAGEE